MVKMEIIVTDSTGTIFGKVKDDTLYNKKGKVVCKVTPKMSFAQMLKTLFLNSQTYIS